MDIPKKIGKYEISEQIGVGGFGAVYRARDPFIKRTVAVKTCQLNDEEIKSRFFREAELAGNLHHRHITTIFDFGVENGIPYIVQEFLSGEDLDKLIKRNEPLTVARKVEILSAIAEGLAFAHRASVIHRDIKPSNIRILDDGSVKIMDFGIAKSLVTESNLTQTGITLGTSAYLAPEQIRGEPLDQRTDIFAVGVLAYELLTGRKPFRGEHLSTVLYKVLNETPEPIESIAPDVPASLASVVRHAMEKEIDGRYPSMEAMRDDLQVVHRELVGTGSPFFTTPRLTQSARPTGAATPEPERPPFEEDETIATPSKGLAVSSITPPSGALARVPERAPRPTPTARSPRAPGGLELVDFRDPMQRAAAARAEAAEPGGEGRGRALLVGGALVAILAGLAVAIVLLRGRIPARAGAPAPRVAPTAPLALPTPALGQEPGKREAPGDVAKSAAKNTPAPAPVVVPTTASEGGTAAGNPAKSVAAGEKGATSSPPEPARAAKKVSVQITSLPMSTLFVDGRKVGPSIPARTVELAQGRHVLRFEHPDFPAYERELKIGDASVPPVVYRFPIGYLVIDAPAWVGANILIDSKFKGVLTGHARFPLKPGTHRVTLSREGVAPLTTDVAIPEGDKETWTPPPPAARSDGS